MKYFEIIKNPQLAMAPRIINWYGKMNVNDIRIDTFYKLPKQTLLEVELTKKQRFTDLILFPFVLVSPMVKDLIKTYGETAFFREIFLLDRSNGNAKLYYLPIFDETASLEIYDLEFAEGVCKKVKPKEKVAIDPGRHIFWVSDSLTRHTIISRDFTESLLRRRAMGLELKEVILCEK